MSAQIICYEILKSSSDDRKREWRDYTEVNSDQLQRLIEHFIETDVAKLFLMSEMLFDNDSRD